MGATYAALALLALYASPTCALDSPAPGPVTSAAQAPAADNSNEAGTPNSTEQGQVQMSDSFDRRPIAALLHDSRLVGLRDTTLNVQLRTYDLDRINFDGSESEAWTLGGSAGFKTGYFGHIAALGATVYTSQRIEGPLDEDGTKLLQPGQKPYTAIGELYGQFRLSDTIVATVGRKAFDTPFINTQDSLMTPNTFVGYAAVGTIGSADERTLRFGAGYIDQIKPRNAQDFESMATAAGAPAGVERGVYMAGANFKAGTLAIGAIDYYSADIINIFYSEFKYVVPLPRRAALRFGAQYADQNSIGNDLLTGKSFAAHQVGFKAELALGPALFTVARTLTGIGTVTGNGAGSGTDMRDPWGSYPGYTNVQIESFYRAGENATMLRAAYNFPRLTGLSVYALWVDGSAPNVKKQYAQKETDLNLKWTPQSPSWKKLTLLARYGHVSQGGPTDQHEDELRLIVYYQFR
jgi:hypothetical protein